MYTLPCDTSNLTPTSIERTYGAAVFANRSGRHCHANSSNNKWTNG